MAKDVMALDEIDAEIARLQGLRGEAERQAELAKVQVNYNEAVQLTTTLVDTLRRLAELGYMPPKLMQALSDQQGKFNPGMYIKKPKAPSSHK